MSLKIQNSKMVVKRSTNAGEEPTLGPSNDFTDGTWSPTDIYAGELMANTVDERLWIGMPSGPREIQMAPGGMLLKSATVTQAFSGGTSYTLVPADFGITTSNFVVFGLQFRTDSYCGITPLSSPEQIKVFTSLVTANYVMLDNYKNAKLTVIPELNSSFASTPGVLTLEFVGNDLFDTLDYGSVTVRAFWLEFAEELPDLP